MKYAPMEELKFTAKFGFLSRKIWEKYFSKRSRTRNIRVWRSFIDEGYFRRHPDDRYKDVLHLAKKGKKTLESAGFEYVSPANAFQIRHDEMVAEIALQVMQSGLIQRYLTEAQAKKRFTDWKKQVRHGESVKYPDLLLYRPDGKVVALELELSRKSMDRYTKMLNIYANQPLASKILFIVNQNVIFDRIARAMKKVYFPTWEKSVAFSFTDGWIDNAMTTKLYLAGNNRATFEEWLPVDANKKTNAA